MTRGFYEQMGVGFDASTDDLRAAYGRSVAHLMRRRDATIGQGGDPGALDLTRARLDESWRVLSDPLRRRRYDAMLAVAGEGLVELDLDNLWGRVSGAMIPPAVVGAVAIVDGATSLGLGRLPVAPRPGRVAEELRRDYEEAPTIGADPSADFGAPRPIGARASSPIALVAEEPNPPTLVPFGPPTVGATSSGITQPMGSIDDALGIQLPPHAPAPPVPAPPARSDLEQLLDIHGPSGAYLKSAREARGMSVPELSEVTRINQRYLEAVEAEDFAALPPTAFVRGYVREIARTLELDEERVVTGYIRRFIAD